MSNDLCKKLLLVDDIPDGKPALYEKEEDINRDEQLVECFQEYINLNPNNKLSVDVLDESALNLGITTLEEYEVKCAYMVVHSSVDLNIKPCGKIDDDFYEIVIIKSEYCPVNSVFILPRCTWVGPYAQQNRNAGICMLDSYIIEIEFKTNNLQND